MDSLDYGRLAYLGLLGTVLVFWFFVHNSDGIGTKLKQVAAWGFIFLGVVAAAGLWEDIRMTVQPRSIARVSPEGAFIVPRAQDGHYYLTLDVNGQSILFMVDTGASQIVLSREDAERIGVNSEQLEFYSRAMTANGEVRIAPVTIESVSLGPVEDRAVPAWVNEGEMNQSLLGMSYLSRWDRIEITNAGLQLIR